jgi:hypothetical protein
MNLQKDLEMQDSVHAIVYISSKNQKKEQLINAGVTGISGYVDGFGTISQKLMCREFPLPSTAEILYKTTISFSIYLDTPNSEAETLEEKYTSKKIMKIAIIHENNRIHDIPYFSAEALLNAKEIKERNNKVIEKTGENLFFHVGGPQVSSDDNSVRFSMDENELSTCSALICTAYVFEDSFKTRKDYKNMLERIETVF